MRTKSDNLRRAVVNLQNALADPIERDRDLGGIIKAFECAYELAWTCTKAHLTEQGHDSQGARDVFRTAWRLGMLPGEDDLWFEMLVHRNLTVHTYDPIFARQLVELIRGRYTPALIQLATQLQAQARQT